MVFALRPDSRATLRKLMPRSALCSFRGMAFCCGVADNHRGRASASTLSKERTSAERLTDLRKSRREEDKRLLPGSLGRAKIRPSLLYAREPRVCKLRRKQIPHAEDNRNEFQAYSALLGGAMYFLRLRDTAIPLLLVVPGAN